MKLTPAARRALDVVAAHDGTARESNHTDLGKGFIYWQTLRTLQVAGLVEVVHANPVKRIRLTTLGRLTLDPTLVERLTPSGVDYCRAHNGVRETDEHQCDNRGTLLEERCDTCDGEDVLPCTDPAVQCADPECEPDRGRHWIVCPACDGGEGTPCDLTPLIYEALP